MRRRWLTEIASCGLGCDMMQHKTDTLEPRNRLVKRFVVRHSMLIVFWHNVQRAQAGGLM